MCGHTQCALANFVIEMAGQACTCGCNGMGFREGFAFGGAPWIWLHKFGPFMLHFA